MRINSRGGAVPPKHQSSLPRFAWVLRMDSHGLVGRGRFEGYLPEGGRVSDETRRLKSLLAQCGIMVADETVENEPRGRRSGKDVDEDVTG